MKTGQARKMFTTTSYTELHGTLAKAVVADTVLHAVEQKGGRKDGRGLHIRRSFLLVKTP